MLGSSSNSRRGFDRAGDHEHLLLSAGSHCGCEGCLLNHSLNGQGLRIGMLPPCAHPLRSSPFRTSLPTAFFRPTSRKSLSSCEARVKEITLQHGVVLR